MTSQQEEITTETIPQLFPALTFQALLPHPPPPYFSLLQSLIIKQTAEVKINFIREGVIRRQHALLDRVLFRSIELNWTCTDEFVGFIFYLYTKVAGDYCTALYVPTAIHRAGLDCEVSARKAVGSFFIYIFFCVIYYLSRLSFILFLCDTTTKKKWQQRGNN